MRLPLALKITLRGDAQQHDAMLSTKSIHGLHLMTANVMQPEGELWTTKMRKTELHRTRQSRGLPSRWPKNTTQCHHLEYTRAALDTRDQGAA